MKDKKITARECKINGAARYSKINLDIVLAYLIIQDNNRYNIYIQFSIQYLYTIFDTIFIYNFRYNIYIPFSIQYQDCSIKNIVLS